VYQPKRAAGVPGQVRQTASSSNRLNRQQGRAQGFVGSCGPIRLHVSVLPCTAASLHACVPSCIVPAVDSVPYS
jgi:hypothetical protein